MNLSHTHQHSDDPSLGDHAKRHLPHLLILFPVAEFLQVFVKCKIKKQYNAGINFTITVKL